MCHDWELGPRCRQRWAGNKDFIYQNHKNTHDGGKHENQNLPQGGQNRRTG